MLKTAQIKIRILFYFCMIQQQPSVCEEDQHVWERGQLRNTVEKLPDPLLWGGQAQYHEPRPSESIDT